MNRIVQIVVLAVMLLPGSFSAPFADKLIFGGAKAKISQFPFLVSLRVFDDQEYRHLCGASILSDRILLSAAHCLSLFRPINQYRISVGALTREEDGQIYLIERFIQHPGFDAQIIDNDIGLIVLKDPIKFNENTSAIDIGRDFITGKEEALAAGWGQSDDQYSGLKYANLTTMSNDECRKLVPANAPVKDFGTLCAFSGVEGTGICSGDSGGPLISNDRLIGVASWARLCARGIPDWIDTEMKAI